MLDHYILSLARDYLFYADAMTTSRAYTTDELREIASQRSLVHDELIRVLGDAYARPYDMIAYCRQLLAAA
jgi:hypothetical protein